MPRTSEHRLQIQWLAPDGSVVREGDRVLDFDNSVYSRMEIIESQIDTVLPGGSQ